MATYLSDIIQYEQQAIQLRAALTRQYSHEVGYDFETILINRQEYIVRVHGNPKISEVLHDRLKAFELGFDAAYGIGGT